MKSNIGKTYGKDLLTDFITELQEVREHNEFYRELYNNKLFGALVIRDWVPLGNLIAWTSGANHRLSKQHRALRMVESKTLQVLHQGMSFNSFQPVPMSIEEATREITNPSWLGCDPTPLFETAFEVVFPNPALFLYPENYVVPKQEREVLSRIIAREEVEIVIFITKSPILMTEFMPEAMWVLTQEGEIKYGTD